MSFIRFIPVADDLSPLTIAVSIAGGSGTGKTFSALRLARGIAGGESFGVVDTENRRALHYRADFPEMHHFDMSPEVDGKMVGFPPERWIEVLDAAEKAGLKVLVIDSFSHAWEGIGGVLELHATTLERITKGDESKADRMSQLAWAEIKPRFRRLVDRIIRSKCHIIICIRAKPVMQKIGGGNARPTKLRRPDLAWDIAADKDLVFEMTASFLMTPEAPGVPVMLKCADQFKGIFGSGSTMGEAQGDAMRAWASGEVDRATKKALDAARDAARKGSASINAYWSSLDRDGRALFVTIKEELRKIAADADAAMDDDPFGLPPLSDPLPSEAERAAAMEAAAAEVMARSEQ